MSHYSHKKTQRQRGEYRIFNQLDEVYTILELAERVVKTARKLGINVKIQNLQNPRMRKKNITMKWIMNTLES